MNDLTSERLRLPSDDADPSGRDPEIDVQSDVRFLLATIALAAIGMLLVVVSIATLAPVAIG